MYQTHFHTPHWCHSLFAAGRHSCLVLPHSVDRSLACHLQLIAHRAIVPAGRRDRKLPRKLLGKGPDHTRWGWDALVELFSILLLLTTLLGPFPRKQRGWPLCYFSACLAFSKFIHLIGNLFFNVLMAATMPSCFVCLLHGRVHITWLQYCPADGRESVAVHFFLSVPPCCSVYCTRHDHNHCSVQSS